MVQRAGACARCDGPRPAPAVRCRPVVPDPSLSLRAGAIAAWGSADGRYYETMLAELLAALPVDADKPFGKLAAGVRERVLRGGGQARATGRDRRPRAAPARSSSAGAATKRATVFCCKSSSRSCCASAATPAWRAPESARAGAAHRRREHPRAGALELEPWRCGSRRCAARASSQDHRADRARSGRALARADRSRRRLPRPRARERARCRAARPSASGWPRTSARACAACCTCSTSRRPACTARHRAPACARCARCAIAATPLLVVEHDLDVIAAADHVIDLGPGRRRARRARDGERHAGARSPRRADAPTAPYLTRRSRGAPARAPRRRPSASSASAARARTTCAASTPTSRSRA